MILCYFNNLPTCIIKHILNFTDIITTIKFSITCKQYLKTYYPPIKTIISLFNIIIKVKNIKHNIATHCDIGMNYEYGYECCFLCFYDESHINNECTSCKKPCCDNCIIDNYCIQCYKCNNCNIIKKDKNNECKLCHLKYCNNCKKYGITCGTKQESHFVCNNCTNVLYYCNICKTKKCNICIKYFGSQCISCTSIKKNNRIGKLKKIIE